MTHSSFKNDLYVCCIFSTRSRSSLLLPEIREQLWKYMEDISWESYIRTLAVGGAEGHIHFLLGLPSPITMKYATRVMKDTSAQWINDNVEGIGNFEWQRGCKASCISSSKVEETVRHIGRQGRDYEHDRPSFHGKDEDIDFF